MADNYYQFSCALDGLSAKEVVWLKKVLCYSMMEAATQEHSWTRLKKELGLQAADFDHWEFYPDFEWQFEPDGSNKTRLWISSGDSGNLEQVALVTQRFMKKFDKDGVIKFTAAYTCSKMRIDEFGGDAVLITKHDCYWLSAFERMVQAALEEKSDQRLEHTGLVVNIEVDKKALK